MNLVFFIQDIEEVFFIITEIIIKNVCVCVKNIFVIRCLFNIFLRYKNRNKG